MHPLTLTDGRLVLRPPLPRDVEAVFHACQDPAVARWTTVPSPYTRNDAEEWVLRLAPASWAATTHLVWYVFRPAEPDLLLASVALHHIDLKGGIAEIGYWAAPEARGQGVMTDAVRLLSRWAFDELGVHRIDWLAAVGNNASLRVAEKAGFRLEGTSRSRLVLHGVREDAWVAGLLAGETTGQALPITATPVPDDQLAGPAPAVDTGDAARPWEDLRDIEITAGSLHLRPWNDGDVPALARLIDDPAIALWNPFTREGTAVEDAERFVRRRTDERHRLRDGANDLAHVSFAVVDATTGVLLGCVALHHLDRGDGSGEVGYWTVPEARGRGVAGQALGTVTRWAFGALELERIDLFHAVGNDASCRVATRAGYALEATMRESFEYGDGVRHDEHLHARLATDPEPSSVPPTVQ